MFVNSVKLAGNVYSWTMVLSIEYVVTYMYLIRINDCVDSFNTRSTQKLVFSRF